MLAPQLSEFDAGELLVIGFDQAEVSELLEGAEIAPGDPKGSPVARQGTKAGVSVRILVNVSNVEPVERALAATGKANREQALIEVCEAFVNLKAKAMNDAIG